MIGNVNDPTCIKTAGVDDQYDDKMANPTKAPTARRSRQLGADTRSVTLNINSYGTPAGTIQAGLASIASNGLLIGGKKYAVSGMAISDLSTSNGGADSGAAGPTLCFSAFEQVTLENGESKAISEVEVGDRVLAVNAAGDFVYSDVVFLPHAKNEIEADFTQIITESGRDIKMTGLHMIPSGDCSAQGTLPLVYANSVATGSCIRTVDGLEKVTDVKKSVESGVYSVVTMDEMVVVNGVVASPFGISHTFPNIYYNIHRFLYRAFPEISGKKTAQDTNEFVGKMLFSMFSF